MQQRQTDKGREIQTGREKERTRNFLFLRVMNKHTCVLFTSAFAQRWTMLHINTKSVQKTKTVTRTGERTFHTNKAGQNKNQQKWKSKTQTHTHANDVSGVHHFGVRFLRM